MLPVTICVIKLSFRIVICHSVCRNSMRSDLLIDYSKILRNALSRLSCLVNESLGYIPHSGYDKGFEKHCWSRVEYFYRSLLPIDGILTQVNSSV